MGRPARGRRARRPSSVPEVSACTGEVTAISTDDSAPSTAGWSTTSKVKTASEPGSSIDPPIGSLPRSVGRSAVTSSGRCVTVKEPVDASDELIGYRQLITLARRHHDSLGLTRSELIGLATLLAAFSTRPWR